MWQIPIVLPHWNSALTELGNSEASSSYLQRLSVVLDHVQQGDSQAEQTVHRQFVDKLLRVASKRISARFRAKIAPEEIVQSVFVSFFRRHKNHEFQFDDWNDLWALLLRITVRKCADRIAEFQTLKRDVRRELSANDSKLPSGFGTPSLGPTPEEVVIFEETVDQLFDRLNDIQQKIVLMRLQGMSNLEISQLINRTERTVYRMLNQIKEQFLDMNPNSCEPL